MLSTFVTARRLRQQRAVLFAAAAQQVDDFLRAVMLGLEIPQIGMAVAISSPLICGRDFLN